jgi:hypothetical protein
MSFEIVIARHNEDISWAKHVQCDQLTVYDKGLKDSGLPSIGLPNVGGEAHTYLWHILHRWDDLADVTAFLLGSLQKHIHSVRLPLELYNTVSQDPTIPICVQRLGRDSFWPGRIAHRAHWLKALENGDMRPAALPMGEWYQQYIGGELPKIINYNPAASFSVPRDTIRRRTRDFYERLIKTVSDHRQPEEAHYLERMWLYVFQNGRAV